MSRISQFQKYSQKENTVTNNVLLMLSRLYNIKIEYYESLVNLINNDSDYFPYPIFNQQRKEKKGIFDGRIEIKASKIIIETKLYGKDFKEKLMQYTEGFSSESKNFLWHIGTEKYNDDEEKKIKNEIKPSLFKSLTFSEIVDNLEEIYTENKHNEELKLLFNDFRDYCNEANLLPDYKTKSIFVPTGFSFDWNVKHKIYFCPISWHKQKFTYFGLYINKSVRTIATVEKCIVADFDKEKQKLEIHTGREEITENQKRRLEEGLKDRNEDQRGLKYYLFKEDDFFETDFKKISKYGIRGAIYKNLKDFLNTEEEKKALDDENTKLIAKYLKNKTW